MRQPRDDVRRDAATLTPQNGSFACTLAGAIENLAMHKDKPPGIFDLGDRSMRYAAGFCFVVGFLVSVLVRIGVLLARQHFSQATPWSGF
jgi:hypothetical protein